MANTGCRESCTRGFKAVATPPPDCCAIASTPFQISLNLPMTADVLSCVMMCLGRMVMMSPERAGRLGFNPTARLVASFSMRVRGDAIARLYDPLFLLRRQCSQILRDIKVHKIRVVE